MARRQFAAVTAVVWHLHLVAEFGLKSAQHEARVTDLGVEFFDVLMGLGHGLIFLKDRAENHVSGSP